MKKRYQGTGRAKVSDCRGPRCSRELNVEPRPIELLEPYARNPRTHSARQIGQLVESIRKFGFTNPILIDTDGGVIAGHGRLAAAKLLGMDTVPTILLDQMTDVRKRAYVLADNKLAQNAGWDRELLALELEYLTELELDFDISVTGFETAEIDLLVDELKLDKTVDKADRVPAVDPACAAVSKPGDLWLLGKHRLLCGNPAPMPSRLLIGSKLPQIATESIA